MNEPSESATSTRRIAALLVDLGSNSAVARNRAHRELVSLREAAVESLIVALRTSTEYGRGQAAKALGEIGDGRAAPALAKALEDDKFDVRWMAALGVVALGRAGLAALLQALIERPNSTLLRESAHHVLHNEAHEKWSKQLVPVGQALEGFDPASELPMAATRTLQAISTRLTSTTNKVAGYSQ
jgi:hypothetical protein